MVNLILGAIASCVFLWSFRRHERYGPNSHQACQSNSQSRNATNQHPISEAEKGKGGSDRYLNKPENLVALATLIAVCIYTGITGFLYNFTVVSSHQQLRAYVGTPAGTYKLICQGCVPRPDGAASGTYEIKMFVKNFGSTPAMLPRTCAQPISVEHAGAVDHGDLELMQRQCDQQDASSGHQTTIWPGDVVPIEIPFGPSEAITRSRRGFPRAFVLGYTTYDDIFGGHHTSWYCNQYKRDGQQDVFTGCDRANMPSDF